MNDSESRAVTVSELVGSGFRRLGCWQPSSLYQGIELDFTSAREPGVYAYVIDNTVHYIGSAQRGLHNRFRQYATTKTMRTAARIREEILICIALGKTVEVYTLVPPTHTWNGLPVDLIAGLEEGLIRTLRPAWNRRSNRRSA